MIDLNPHHLKTVKRILAEHLPDCEVRAFGSRATWTAWEYSDLDLAVVSPEPLDRRTSANLREAFEESDLPIRVDVVDWATLTDGFRQVIEGDCVVVQEAVRSSEWREYTIGEIADVVGGATPSTKNPHNFNGDIPWLTPKDLSGLHDRSVDRGARNLSQQGLDSSSARLLPPGSVLLSTRAPIGYVALAKNAISTNQGFRSLVMRDGFSAEYMYYWLLTNTEELERHASGSTFRELSGSSLKTIRLKLPPLDEQRRIAGILGALDDKIELNRRMSQTLEAMAQALFKSWFVDFDPVRAKTEGRWRPGESLPGLPALLYPLFPDRLVPSQLGDIPEGWEARSLDEIADFTNGLALQRFPPEGNAWLPAIKIAEIRRGYSAATGKASPDIDPAYVVHDGDLLFSWSGSLEVTLWTHGRGALNQHLFKVSSKRFPKWFYWGWLGEYLPNFREIAADKATTMGHIRRHHLTDAKLPVPAPPLLSSADAILTPLLKQTICYGVTNRTLATLRDVMLPKIVSR